MARLEQHACGGAARLEDRAALVGVERAVLAEGVDPAGLRGAAVEHLAAHEVDVGVAIVGVFGRNDMSPEKGDFIRHFGG